MLRFYYVGLRTDFGRKNENSTTEIDRDQFMNCGIKRRLCHPAQYGFRWSSSTEQAPVCRRATGGGAQRQVSRRAQGQSHGEELSLFDIQRGIQVLKVMT
jgi:hypothetical protein